MVCEHKAFFMIYASIRIIVEGVYETQGMKNTLENQRQYRSDMTSFGMYALKTNP
jgi:hypothetical protein